MLLGIWGAMSLLANGIGRFCLKLGSLDPLDPNTCLYCVIVAVCIVLLQNLICCIGRVGVNMTSCSIGVLLFVAGNPTTWWLITTGYLPLAVVIVASMTVYLCLSALLVVAAVATLHSFILDQGCAQTTFSSGSGFARMCLCLASSSN
jgi:hypothetical protein